MYDIGSILTSASSGGITGSLSGYAIKKEIKIIMTIAGLFLAGLAYLNYQELINIDWGKVVSVTNTAIRNFQIALADMSPP